ncbi:MAG: ABC transporter substrate-binding protein, partial [Thermoproteota archaeon]|nr:ABC transporter substrate-binding protein [Thermoproteota archaeon]
MENKKVICNAILLLLLGIATITPLFSSNVEASNGDNMVFDMQVLSWDTISVDAGMAIREELAEIGISVTVSITDDAVMYPNLYALPRDYRMYEMSHGFGGYPDHVWYRMHSCNDIDWGDNCYGLHNDTMDAALDDLLHATNETARIEAAAEVQALSVELAPYIPLFLSDDTHAIRKEWVNYTFVPGGIFTSMNRLTMLNIYSTDANDTFVMAYPSDVGEMNPLFSRSERTGWYLIQVYDSLLAYDTEMNPIPWLAESWDASEDAKNFTFHLREGMKWHDGVPLNASDIKFTLDYYKAAPEDALSWSLLQKMVDCTVHDEYTVSVVFNESMGFGLTQVGDINIVPKHIRDWGDWEHGNSQHAACWDDPTNVTAHTGSGPFKFVERVPD